MRRTAPAGSKGSSDGVEASRAWKLSGDLAFLPSGTFPASVQLFLLYPVSFHFLLEAPRLPTVLRNKVAPQEGVAGDL